MRDFGSASYKGLDLEHSQKVQKFSEPGVTDGQYPVLCLKQILWNEET